ncbi:hypothetical protein [uncultured Psychroserpens sp.]|uniref:hypothetical protein n=1 Tax=uncultured Psychroserpens sp. TaxID=255436 RepID=UPI00263473C4|nr:hypothetical protein [uncultured Psychroserpens sp.]
MDDYQYLYTVSHVIYNLASLLVVISCIVIVTKKRTLATILMLIGSVFAFLFGIGSIYIYAFTEAYGTDSSIKMNAISNLISGLAYIIFCLGLLLFAISHFKKDRTKNEFLD